MTHPRALWGELFPDLPWPGDDEATVAMADEIRALRLLTDTIVSTAVEAEGRMRSRDAIQRAHDLVGAYCVETQDERTMHYVSALCWVLRHDHNVAFAQVIAAVEEQLKKRGMRVVRLPEPYEPTGGKV